MEKKPARSENLLGIVVIFGLITGFAGLLAAVAAFFSAEWVGAGVCLVASALAFGLLANAFLRN
jgi:hypothetical protein